MGVLGGERKRNVKQPAKRGKTVTRAATRTPKIADKSTGGQREPFWKRHAREILILALVLLGVHDIFGTHGFVAMWRTQTELKDLRAEIDRLDKENAQMTNQVTALKTDPATIERLAREQMGLAKPGEFIFKLPPSNPQHGQGDPPSNSR